MQIGKLSQEKLEELIFNRIKCRHEEVICGAGTGEDCAILKLKDEYCVLSTDPITAASDGIAKLSIHINANDVASAGAEAFAMLVTMLIPPQSTEAEVKKVLDELMETADKENIDIIGGHTEITDAVNRIVISATVLGKAKKPIATRGAKAGDSLVITKTAGIEGTRIICMDYPQAVKDLDESEINEADSYDELLSVSKEAVIAAEIGVNAMHDITEGGVLGAVYEMAAASELGALVCYEDIPVSRLTAKVCSAAGIDPLRLISSGSMLIACSPSKKDVLVNELCKKGIPASCIGELTKDKKMLIKSKTGLSEISPPGSDEIYKAVSRFGGKD